MPVREEQILQEDQKEMRSQKLPSNPKKGIKTILHQFLNTLARGHSQKSLYKESPATH